MHYTSCDSISLETDKMETSINRVNSRFENIQEVTYYYKSGRLNKLKVFYFIWKEIPSIKTLLGAFLVVISSVIIFRREITAADNPEEKWKEKEAEYAEMFANPYNAAARGYVDEVINPSTTREKLIRAFKMLENKVDVLPKKKHGNIPL